jgi:threonine synthase
LTSATSLGAPAREVAFSVPTGNFGNVLAGWAAMRMGLPVDQLVVGSNRNDILTRFLYSGVMTITEVHPTLSPSMDIQVSSNFERLLFEADDRRGSVVAEQMAHFRAHGVLTVTADQLAWIRQTFDGACIDDERTIEVIAETYRASGLLIDPHTAVGLDAGRQCWRDRTVPLVALSTAHPAKFPDAVEKATGVRPALPEHLADLHERPERFTVLANDLALVQDLVATLVA